MKRIKLQKVFRIERNPSIPKEVIDKNLRLGKFKRRVFQQKNRNYYRYGMKEFEERVNRLSKRVATPIIIYN